MMGRKSRREAIPARHRVVYISRPSTLPAPEIVLEPPLIPGRSNRHQDAHDDEGVDPRPIPDRFSHVDWTPRDFVTSIR